MIEVQEINNLTSLRHFEFHWNALLQVTPGRSFFHSYDWFVARCRTAATELRIRVLVVLDDGRPLGILPLIVETRNRRLGGVRVLCYPLSDWGAFYGPIGAQPAAVLDAGLKHIASTLRDWDIIDLCWVNKQEPDGAAAESILRDAGFAPHEALHTQTAQVEMDGDWDAYWNTRKSHWRTNVRRSEKRLAGQGAVEHLRYRPAGSARGEDDPRWDLYNICVELAARSWQADSTGGTTLSHASVARMLREVHQAAVRRGALDLNLLLINDCPVAFAYNYHYDGYVYGLRMGFDREQCNEGAGSVLLHRILEDSFRRGDRLYDLGPDYLECKRYWWTRLAPVFRYSHFPWAAPKAQAVRLGRWVKRRLSAGV